MGTPVNMGSLTIICMPERAPQLSDCNRVEVQGAVKRRFLADQGLWDPVHPLYTSSSVFLERIQFFSCKHQRQTLEWISVPAGKPGFGKLVPVGIELKPPGGCQSLSPL